MDDETIVKAQRPKDLLRGSVVTPSLEAAIINGKYISSLPLYRMEQEFKRNDVNLNRQNMANWTIECADRYLAVLYDYLHKLLYQYHVLQADETTVEVSKDGRAAGSKSYMWIYRTGKSYAEAIVLYEYQKDRKLCRIQKLVYYFTGEMAFCAGQNKKNRRDGTGTQKEDSAEPGLSADAVFCMGSRKELKACLNDLEDVMDFLKDGKNQVQDWQIAGMNAMLDQCAGGRAVPHEVPMAFKGLLRMYG